MRPVEVRPGWSIRRVIVRPGHVKIYHNGKVVDTALTVATARRRIATLAKKEPQSQKS